MRRLTLIPLLLAACALPGCDLFGESADKIAAAKEAEGRAIGGACRHAGRAIEDCYALNRKADKAAVFNGWRDMNDYMRENKIESVPPQQQPIRGEARAARPVDIRPELPALEPVTEPPVTDRRAARPRANSSSDY